MKAALIESHGGPEKLVVKEVASPTCSPDGLLIQVNTCGINHLDLLVRSGKLPFSIELPRILGLEITGEIMELGDNVKGFKKGDRVTALSRIACGHCDYCRLGDENLCLHAKSLGVTLDGGYAQVVCIPAKNAIKLPENVSNLEASGAALSGLSAWHMLMTQAKIRAGERVLVVSGGSSVGTFAIQLAKAHGCSVFASVGSDHKIEKAYEIGADHVIQHEKQSTSKIIKDLTKQRGVDVVIEVVGAATWQESIESLSRNGRLVTCGAHTGSRVEVNLWKLFSKQISILGAYYGNRGELQSLLAWIADKKIKTVVHEKLPLEACKEGHRILEERKNFGKIILVMN